MSPFPTSPFRKNESQPHGGGLSLRIANHWMA